MPDAPDPAAWPDLPPFSGVWDADDPHANFKDEVALVGRADPRGTLETLSDLTGVPVRPLIRYVLVRWASEGHEMLLHAGPGMVRRMQAVCHGAEEAGTDAARLEAFEVLRQMIDWLAAPLEDDAADPQQPGSAGRP